MMTNLPFLKSSMASGMLANGTSFPPATVARPCASIQASSVRRLGLHARGQQALYVLRDDVHFNVDPLTGLLLRQGNVVLGIGNQRNREAPADALGHRQAG